MNKKTILIVVATGTRINFLLRAPLFRMLLRAGANVVIASPFSRDENFKKEFGLPGVSFVDMPKMSRCATALAFMRTQALTLSHDDLSLARRIHSAVTRRYTKPATVTSRFFSALRAFVLRGIPRRIRQSAYIWDRAERLFVPALCRKIFQEHAPGAVITASGGAEGHDIPFLLEARRRGIPLVAVDSNIDVFEFRYFSRPRFVDQWALFSDVQKNEAMNFAGIEEKNITVTGPIRHDYYFREFKPEPREIFLQRLGLDPSSKLITYGAKIPIMYPWNADIIRCLNEAIREKKFGTNAKLHIRFDPGHDPLQYGDLLDGVTWERAEQCSERSYIANLLYHSDVVVSVGSTFSLEACIVGSPSVWIGFDGYASLPLEESYRYIYTLPLFTRLLKTGGIPLARTPEELVALIKNYLKNRNLDSEKRRDLIVQEYGNCDGRAGERVFEVISKIIR